MRKTAAFFMILLLCLGLAGSALAASAELAQNGDFEVLSDEGLLPAGWFFEAWLADGSETLVESAEMPGKGSAVHIANYVENDSRLCISIDCEPETVYKLTCDIKTENAEGGAGANISVVDSLAASTSVLGTTDWQRVELIGKTGSGQKKLTVAVRLGGYGALSLGEAWFDHVSVTKITEKPVGSISDFSKAESSGGRVYNQGEMPYFGPILLSGFFTALAFIFTYRKRVDIIPGGSKPSDPVAKIVLLLTAAFVVRCIASFIFVGHPTDIACFGGWAKELEKTGLSGFYTSGIFADYPPGYMYFLWVIGKLSSLLGLAYGSAGFVLLLKIPAIFADLITAYLVYRIALKKLPESAAFMLAAVMAFNPAAVFISGGWGQIDSLLTLLLVVCLLLFLERLPLTVER
jgi:hypothetical protein